MSINNPEQRRSTNPDIAESTHDLKALHAQPAVTPDKEHRDKKGMSLKTKLGLGLAGLGIAGTAGFIGKSLAGGSEAAPAPREPEASAPVTPGETAEPTPEVEPEVDKYSLAVADYSTFEEVVRAYYVKDSEYLASASDTYDQPGDPKYLEALYGAGWENNPELAEYVSDIRDISVVVSTNHFATGENGDTEYEHNVEVTDIQDVVEGDGQVSGLVTIHSTDNIMETVLAMNAEENLDSVAQFHLTFTDVSGYWQVTEVDNLNNN